MIFSIWAQLIKICLSRIDINNNYKTLIMSKIKILCKSISEFNIILYEEALCTILYNFQICFQLFEL